MYVDHTPAQKALRAELRAYFAKLVPPEVRAQIRSIEGGPLQRRLIRQMGADGWLGVGWPKEYGGQGRTAIEQQIWFEEARRAGAPLPVRHAQHRRPGADRARAARRRSGASCPASWPARSTSRSATPSPTRAPTSPSLETRAVREGDDFVVNGTKIFTSGADDADYIWLAVPHRSRRRTSTRASRS